MIYNLLKKVNKKYIDKAIFHYESNKQYAYGKSILTRCKNYADNPWRYYKSTFWFPNTMTIKSWKLPILLVAVPLILTLNLYYLLKTPIVIISNKVIYRELKKYIENKKA